MSEERNSPRQEEVEVLIVGGGPVGLGMGIELGRRNISCLVVDDTDGSVHHPRTGLIAMRTMELARQWGISQEIRDAGFPEDYELSIVFCTSLNGFKLAKEPYPSMKNTPTPPETPEKKQRCPQSWMQPVLQRKARASSYCDLRFNVRFTSFSQTSDEVVSSILNLKNGVQSQVRSKYLVACDGANSVIREALGITQTGRLLSYSVNILFDCRELNARHQMGQAERYLFVGSSGTWGNLTVVDGDSTWRLTVLGGTEKFDLDEFDADAWVVKALGSTEIPFEVTSVIPWRRSEMLADEFVRGRAILAGDAIHTTSPTGGMGMNTGMQEVMDLGWKLEALIHGWGGSKLLDSYFDERHPVAKRNLSFSTQNFKAWKSGFDCSLVEENSSESEKQRREFGEILKETTRVEWESTGLQLGHRYNHSKIIIPDGSPEPADDWSVYVQTARPGHRAPHCWMADGRSTLDLFGMSFVLLVFDEIDTSPFEDAANSTSTPLKVISIQEKQIARIYDASLVLVRPDGHVAWRGQNCEEAGLVLDVVCGRH